MTEFALLVLKELCSYYPVVLSNLFVFSLESASSLEIWQAVQRIPHIKSIDADEEEAILQQKAHARKSMQRRKIMCNVAMVLVIGAIIMGPSLLDATKLRMFYLIELLTPLTFIIAPAASNLSGFTVRTVSRDEEGKPTVDYKSSSSCILTLLINVLSASVASIALWTGTPLALLVAYIALLHIACRSSLYDAQATFKAVVRYSIYMSTTTAAFFAMLSLANLPGETLPFGLLARQGAFMEWRSIFISVVLSSATSFNMLAMCYRFDYANTLSPEFQPLANDEAVSARIPYPWLHAHRDAFSRPYWHAAFAAFHLCYVAVAALSVGGIIKCTIENVGVYMVFIAPPAMAATVLLLAAGKGQFGKLWRYKEDWAAVPLVTEVNASLDGITNEGEKGSISLVDETRGEQTV